MQRCAPALLTAPLVPVLVMLSAALDAPHPMLTPTGSLQGILSIDAILQSHTWITWRDHDGRIKRVEESKRTLYNRSDVEWIQ